MSKPFRGADPEIMTAILSELPTVPEMLTGGVAHVVEPSGPRQTSPTAWALGMAGMTKREAKSIIGSMISVLMLFFTICTYFSNVLLRNSRYKSFRASTILL